MTPFVRRGYKWMESHLPQFVVQYHSPLPYSLFPQEQKRERKNNSELKFEGSADLISEQSFKLGDP